MPTTVRADALTRIVDAAAARGVEPTSLFRAAGLNAADVEQPAARLPAPRAYALWREAVRSAGDALPIDVARRTRLDELGLMGFATMTAPTLLAALRTAMRYHALITDDGRWVLDERGPLLVGRWVVPGADAGRCASATAVIAHFVACTRQAAGRAVPFERIELRHGAGAAAAELFDCPIDDDAATASFAVRRDHVDDAPALANAAMHHHFCHLADRALGAPRASVRIDERVRAAVLDRLPDGPPSIAVVARSLGTSSRSLRRHLAAVGTSFRAVLADVRRRRADHLLDATDRSITDIAFELGFADPTAFSRAYTSWTGLPPTARRFAR